MRTGVMAQLTPNVLVVHAAVRVLFFFLSTLQSDV